MFLKYLIEIKNRAILLLITWVLSCFATYCYKETLLFLVIQPNLSQTLPILFYFIFTNVTEVFYVYIDLILFLNTQIFAAYFIYHLLVFFTPAFFSYEYKFIYIYILLFFIVWFISILFSNFFLVPLTWQFFLSFQNSTVTSYSLQLHFEAKLIEYFNFYVSIYYSSYVYFQFFIIFVICISYTNKTINTIALKKSRKFYYYCLVLFSTVISPPDVFIQVLISLLLIFFLELLFLWFFLTRKPIKTNQNSYSKNKIT